MTTSMMIISPQHGGSIVLEDENEEEHTIDVVVDITVEMVVLQEATEPTTGLHIAFALIYDHSIINCFCKWSCYSAGDPEMDI